MAQLAGANTLRPFQMNLSQLSIKLYKKTICIDTLTPAKCLPHYSPALSQGLAAQQSTPRIRTSLCRLVLTRMQLFFSLRNRHPAQMMLNQLHRFLPKMLECSCSNLGMSRRGYFTKHLASCWPNQRSLLLIGLVGRSKESE